MADNRRCQHPVVPGPVQSLRTSLRAGILTPQYPCVLQSNDLFMCRNLNLFLCFQSDWHAVGT